MNTNDSTSPQNSTGSSTGQNRSSASPIGSGIGSGSPSGSATKTTSAKTQSSDKQWNQSPTSQSPESKETSSSTQYKEQASAGKKQSATSSVKNDSSDSRSESGSESGSENQVEWISEMHNQATSLENSVESFIRERPMVSAGVALGLGVGAFFLLRNLSSQETPMGASINPVRSDKSSGFLSQNLVSSLTKIQKEFDKLATDGIGGVRQGVTDLVSKDMESQPIQTLATVVGLGFAAGNLNVDQIKSGAIRIAKLLAVRSLDEVGSKHKAIENKGDSRATN